MIKIEKLSFSYRTEKILDACSAKLADGELVALLGSNGSGKSTLLKCMMGWLNPSLGKVWIDDHELMNMSASQRSSTISIVLSRIPNIPMMTVEETLKVGRLKKDDDHQQLSHWMKVCGISDFANRGLDTLSDGQLQRVMIARALAQETPVLLMDEPFAHLDHPSKNELMTLLQELKAMGKTILFSTHDIHYLNNKVDKVWLLQNKKIDVLEGDFDLNKINWKR